MIPVVLYEIGVMAELEHAGLFAVLHAASVLEQRMEARLAEINLSLAKLAALCHVKGAGEALPLGRLTERLACVKSNVTQLIDRLDADGLVTRSQDPADRRSRLAVLTARGRRAARPARRSGIGRNTSCSAC